jgi:putative salt-induced outer membrane protein
MWSDHAGRIVAAVTFLLMVNAAAAAGQTAPPPPSAPPPPPPPTFEGTGELSFVSTTGNSSTDTIGLAGGVIYRPAPWVLDTKLAFVRTAADSVVNARAVTASSRLARDLSPRTSLFAQYDFLNSPFAGISQRHTVAAGVSYKAIDDKTNTLRLDVGLGYASETPVSLARSSSGTALGGGAYRLKMSDTSEFVEDARIVESLSHGGDWHFDNTVAVTAKLTTKLSLKVSHVTHVVNQPTPGFKKTDTIASAAIVAKF